MSPLNRQAQQFLKEYAVLQAGFQTAAKLIEVEVSRAVKETGQFIHAVTARAKSLDSLRGKLRRKNYKKPKQHLTDLVGVRVIAYYQDAIDPIVDRLRRAFEINEKHSVDKRGALGPREFGYRSVHLVARLKPGQALALYDTAIRRKWFEIQVRTIVEHVWAEIEHEVVYKSGTSYPIGAQRRFARLAGTLELLDTEFRSLREIRSDLVDTYRLAYESGRDARASFDAARLWGFLEARLPRGLSWREATSSGSPFRQELDVSCVEALRACGLSTAMSLDGIISSKKFRRAVDTFASGQGIGSEAVSHLAVVVLAVALKDLPMMQRHFPEFTHDPSLALVLETARRQAIAR
jgi:ppGpp synthetase/RelA/SpoT-type nucleotidyltranferase